MGKQFGLRSPDVPNGDIISLACGAAGHGSQYVSHFHGRVPNVRGAASKQFMFIQSYNLLVYIKDVLTSSVAIYAGFTVYN
jgi:hypothetical protein